MINEEEVLRRIMGFARVNEEAFEQGKSLGWRVHRDHAGWVVEVRDYEGTVFAGKGACIGDAIAALVEGLDILCELEAKDWAKA